MSTQLGRFFCSEVPRHFSLQWWKPGSMSFRQPVVILSKVCFEHTMPTVSANPSSVSLPRRSTRSHHTNHRPPCPVSNFDNCLHRATRLVGIALSTALDYTICDSENVFLASAALTTNEKLLLRPVGINTLGSLTRQPSECLYPPNNAVGRLPEASALSGEQLRLFDVLRQPHERADEPVYGHGVLITAG